MSPYPVTIIRTRYGGAYEGGEWAAFHCDPAEIPSEAEGCDDEAAAFWAAPTVPVGVGATPDAAFEMLRRRLGC